MHVVTMTSFQSDPQNVFSFFSEPLSFAIISTRNFRIADMRVAKDDKSINKVCFRAVVDGEERAPSTYRNGPSCMRMHPKQFIHRTWKSH